MFDSVLKLLSIFAALSILILFSVRVVKFESEKLNFLNYEFQTRRCASIDAAVANIETAANQIKKQQSKQQLYSTAKIDERSEFLSSYFLDLWLQDRCEQEVQARYTLKSQSKSNTPNIEYILSEGAKL